MPVNIHGKEYYTVVERLKMLKNDFKINYSLTTELLQCDNERVVVKATLSIDGNEYTGLAEETRSANKINKTSAVENGETSAIGRALSSAGYYGTEFCSANELEGALAQQEKKLINALEKVEKKYAKPDAEPDAEHPLADTIKSTMETISVDESTDEIIDFGKKHKGEKWCEVDEGWLEWVANNNSKYGDKAQKYLDARQGKILDEEEVPF